MNGEIIKTFKELKVTGQRFGITPEEKRDKDITLISYLKSLIEEKTVTDFEDVGFCYWNISDNLALTKNGAELYENHKKFYEHIKNSDPVYLYWTVSDATQRLALEKDGLTDFWWSLYKEAVGKNTNSSVCFAEFCAHRAALYTNESLTVSSDNLDFAKRSFENFLKNTEGAAEYGFYKAIHLSLISRFSKVDNRELIDICRSLFENLSAPKTQNEFLAGEWKSFVTPFDKRRQGIVGITSAVNALIYQGNTEDAKALYQNAKEAGLPQNRYIESRLK